MTSEQQPVFPPGRYGRRRTARRTPRGVLTAGVIVLVAVFTFIGYTLYRAYGDQDYSAEVTRFSTADRSVDVQFFVRLPDGGRADCVLRARGSDGLEVGRATVAVTAGSEPAHTVVEYRLATTARPVTGEIVACTPAATSADSGSRG
ncbi:DUF4307 domain-containing protein [Hamadaea tsunoensis]|uniref:DUF4307 domain-containing protein n=1 Tax=Hamadaea tsunoensis TaxID=53368 RepID=UPI0003FD669B|nr:DUF4307 domain-containing protein [Hamadaea tsunoensis]